MMSYSLPMNLSSLLSYSFLESRHVVLYWILHSDFFLKYDPVSCDLLRKVVTA